MVVLNLFSKLRKRLIGPFLLAVIYYCWFACMLQEIKRDSSPRRDMFTTPPTQEVGQKTEQEKGAEEEKVEHAMEEQVF